MGRGEKGPLCNPGTKLVLGRRNETKECAASRREERKKNEKTFE